jgi:hypothetical protein
VVLSAAARADDAVLVGAADGDEAEPEHVADSHRAQRSPAVAAQPVGGAGAHHLPRLVAHQAAHHGHVRLLASSSQLISHH